MADPFTILGLVLQGSSILGGLGAQGREAQLEQEQSFRNQQLAKLAALDAKQRGQRNATIRRMQGARLAARQALAYTAAGVDPTSGTPADVIASTGAMAELDALTEENNAAREAWGLELQVAQFGRQAEFAQERARGQMLGTILGGLGQAVGSMRRLERVSEAKREGPAAKLNTWDEEL